MSECYCNSRRHFPEDHPVPGCLVAGCCSRENRLDHWQLTALGVIRQPEPPLSIQAGVHLAEYLLDACLALRSAEKRIAELETTVRAEQQLARMRAKGLGGR